MNLKEQELEVFSAAVDNRLGLLKYSDKPYQPIGCESKKPAIQCNGLEASRATADEVKEFADAIDKHLNLKPAAQASGQSFLIIEAEEVTPAFSIALPTR